MKIYFTHEWKKRTVFLRIFDIMPCVSYNTYENYSFESLRISWLGFMIGFYNQTKKQ